jgi:hypothetical protein
VSIYDQRVADELGRLVKSHRLRIQIAAQNTPG